MLKVYNTKEAQEMRLFSPPPSLSIRKQKASLRVFHERGFLFAGQVCSSSITQTLRLAMRRRGHFSSDRQFLLPIHFMEAKRPRFNQ